MQGAQWFGGCSPEHGGVLLYGQLRPSGAISLAPKWLLRARMTATAIMFIGSGFAVAADGNQLLGDPPNFVADLSIGETDCAQKVFGAEGCDFALAYILRGKIATEHRTFDAAVEMQKEMAYLSTLRFKGHRELVTRAAKGIYRRVWAARESGLLPCFLGMEIPFVGYFNGDPFCLTAHFFPDGHYQVTGQALDGWLFMFSGSKVIANLMENGDQRIGHRIKGPDDHPSLQDAVDATRTYIKACSSQWGLEADPQDCRGLGGHIHVATVTPPLRPSWIVRIFAGKMPSGGFAWVIPPVTKSGHVSSIVP